MSYYFDPHAEKELEEIENHYEPAKQAQA